MFLLLFYFVWIHKWECEWCLPENPWTRQLIFGRILHLRNRSVKPPDPWWAFATPIFSRFFSIPHPSAFIANVTSLLNAGPLTLIRSHRCWECQGATANSLCSRMNAPVSHGRARKWVKRCLSPKWFWIDVAT